MAFFFSRRRKQHTNAQVGKADAEDTKVENRVSPFLSILRIVRELRLSDHDDGGNDETQREPDVGGVETADAETTATPGDGPQRLDVLAAGPPEFQESKFFNEVMAKAGAIRAPEEEPQKAQRAFQSVSVIFRPNQHQEPLPQDGFPDLDLVLILMPEEQRQQCVHGWLTPRMIFRLTKSASTSAEMCRCGLLLPEPSVSRSAPLPHLTELRRTSRRLDGLGSRYSYLSLVMATSFSNAIFNPCSQLDGG